MPRNKTRYDITLTAWAEEFASQHWEVPEGKQVSSIQRLINQTTFDLLYGPYPADDGSGDSSAQPGAGCFKPATTEEEEEEEEEDDWKGYPGFSTACQQIQQALREVPYRMFLDVDAGTWQRETPDNDTCDVCEGAGYITTRTICQETASLLESREKCDTCNGVGSFDPAGDWYQVERSELVRALVGQYLHEHVS